MVSSSMKVGVAARFIPTGSCCRVPPASCPGSATVRVEPEKNTEGSRSSASSVGRAMTSLREPLALAMFREYWMPAAGRPALKVVATVLTTPAVGPPMVCV